LLNHKAAPYLVKVEYNSLDFSRPLAYLSLTVIVRIIKEVQAALIASGLGNSLL
jgi:hypothetical protein